MTPLVVLVGAPGSGKTTIGQSVANALQVRFRDTDHDVEQQVGMAISELFGTRGEAACRDLETEAIRRALVEHDGVLALGGGAVLREENRALLDGHNVVWLEVSLADAVQRVGLGVARPLLLGNVRARLKTLLDERTPFYAAVARHTIPTHDRTRQQVTAAVIETIRTDAHG